MSQTDEEIAAELLSRLGEAKAVKDPVWEIEGLLLRAIWINWPTGAKKIADELKKCPGGLKALVELINSKIKQGQITCVKEMIQTLPAPEKQELSKKLIQYLEKHGQRFGAAQARQLLKIR